MQNITTKKFKHYVKVCVRLLLSIPAKISCFVVYVRDVWVLIYSSLINVTLQSQNIMHHSKSQMNSFSIVEHGNL